MNRPYLRQIPLEHALPIKRRQCYVTMSAGQWDTLLRAAYEVGFILLELDDEERPVAAYQKETH